MVHKENIDSFFYINCQVCLGYFFLNTRPTHISAPECPLRVPWCVYVCVCVCVCVCCNEIIHFISLKENKYFQLKTNLISMFKLFFTVKPNHLVSV